MDWDVFAVSFGHRCFDLLLLCISWCEMAVLFVCLLIRSFRWVYCGYSCYFCFFCWMDLMMVLLMWNPMWSHYMMYPYTWQSGYALFRFLWWQLLITPWRVLLLAITFPMLISCRLSPSCRVFHCRDPSFYWACSCLPFRVWTAFPDCIDCEVFPSEVMILLVSDWWLWWLVLP